MGLAVFFVGVVAVVEEADGVAEGVAEGVVDEESGGVEVEVDVIGVVDVPDSLARCQRRCLR